MSSSTRILGPLVASEIWSLQSASTRTLMGLEREIDDADLRRLKFFCELHFDSYRSLYEPLKAFLARSPPKYRAQLTSLLQPSESLIYDFASVSGNPQQRLILVTAAYEGCL